MGTGNPNLTPGTPTSYDRGYYGPNGPAENRESAEHIVPLVSSLIHPSSVVDVGCGSGAWLDIFQKYGTERILGLDGNNVIQRGYAYPRSVFVRWT